MFLWLAHRAWNLFWDPQGDCFRWRGAFLSCGFGLPKTGSSLAVHSGSLDSLHSSSGTSSSSVWALGLKWNGPKPLEPSGPTLSFWKTFFFFGFFPFRLGFLKFVISSIIKIVFINFFNKISNYCVYFFFNCVHLIIRNFSQKNY